MASGFLLQLRYTALARIFLDVNYPSALGARTQLPTCFGDVMWSSQAERNGDAVCRWVSK